MKVSYTNMLKLIFIKKNYILFIFNEMYLYIIFIFQVLPFL